MKQPDLDLFEELSEERGFSLIPLQGEVPIEKDWTRYCTEKRSFPRTEFEGRNAGVACGPASGVLVLDVDAPEIFSRACKDKGRDLPPTLTVTTGSGKPHYYFAYPMDGKTYGCRACKSEGYDARGLGGQVVAPGSCHPQTGKLYTISKDLPLAPAPKWLLDLARKDEPRREPPSQRPTSIWSGNVDVLPISEETKELIRNGAPLGHRSEAVMSVVNALVWANLADSEIFGIFESYSIGDKYREKGNARERWLQAHIDKARAFVAIRAGDSSPPKRTFTTEGDRSHLETPPDFHLTDVGNAELMVWLHGKNIRYCHPWKTWFVWDGMRHLEDETGEIYRIGKDTVRHRYAQAARETESDRRKALAKFATRSESDRSIQAMISSARSEPGIPVRPADLDADPWLFNCPNGTVNLRNGDLLPHNRADNITKLAGAPYIHGSESPLLQSVLNRCMGGNDRLTAFLQRLCGYALTGDTSEQILPIFYGIGQNGKGTLTETLRKVLADYARNADIGTFLAKHNEEARHDLARLKGARLVTATETDADSKLAEALVKRITGEDPVTCRHLYQGAFEYIPSWKLFLAVNHKPQIWGTD